MARIQILLILALLIIINPLMAADEKETTPEEYWQIIRKLAATELSSANLELELDTGYTYYFEKGTDYPGNNISVGVKFPIYSAKEKRAKRDIAVAFQRDGAKLIADLEKALSMKRLYISELPWLKMRREDGIDAAKEYIELQRKIVEQEALIAMAHRELQALIEPFSGNADKVKRAAYLAK